MPPAIRTRAEKDRIQFGDFQTPSELARQAVAALPRLDPASIIEPCCGTGSFLEAAAASFPRARLYGFEINRRHLAEAQARLRRRATLQQADFFQTNWPAVLSGICAPLLILGNPPWVTSSALGAIRRDNLPAKKNHAGLAGIAARTGKSNFDVSESMLSTLLEAVGDRSATIAMLCKTAVAQKVLQHAWSRGIAISRASIRRIDAQRHFSASVDACLFICCINGGRQSRECGVYADLRATATERTFGIRDGRMLADVSDYVRIRHLFGQGGTWRSGLKHDCSDLFELRRDEEGLVNGLGAAVSVEADQVFPLLKSSALAAGYVKRTDRAVIVTQRRVGEGTDRLAESAPRLWSYLNAHGERLDARASSIYRDQPRFSVFGVGPYTFSPWKVAVSGFYPQPRFSAVGPIGGKPVLFDDTCYFLPCDTEVAARRTAESLNGEAAGRFFKACMPPGSKRPLTAEILRSLDLERLEADIGAQQPRCDSKGRPRRNGR